MEQEKNIKEEQRYEGEILDKIVKDSEFGIIPEILIDSECHKMSHEFEAAIERQGLKFDDYLKSINKTKEQLAKEFGAPAEERVKAALVVRKIANLEKIEVRDDKIDKEIADLKEKTSEIELKWGNEKNVLTDIKVGEFDSYFFTKWQQMVNMLLFREDIRDLTNIQEIQQLELLSIILKNQAGSLVNLSKLAQKVQVSVMTIKRWLETLEQFFYCFQIKPWTTNINRSLLKEPKIYLWNWALITEEGSRFENFVACHLLKAVHFWTDVGIGKFDLYFLRDKDKNEVDFLVTRDDQPWFLAEAKLSSHQGISKSLYQFQEKTRAKHAFQITWNEPYVDEDCFIHDKPIIVPAQTFLSQLI